MKNEWMCSLLSLTSGLLWMLMDVTMLFYVIVINHLKARFVLPSSDDMAVDCVSIGYIAR